MSVATLQEINTFLPEFKLQAIDADVSGPADDAITIIKAQLSNTFSAAILAVWVDPTTTPDIIRKIAARLTAALIYARRYSEEQGERNTYAQSLYDQAMSLIGEIVDGTITIPDIPADDTDSGHRLTLDMISPVDSSTRKFSMADRF